MANNKKVMMSKRRKMIQKMNSKKEKYRKWFQWNLILKSKTMTRRTVFKPKYKDCKLY